VHVLRPHLHGIAATLAGVEHQGEGQPFLGADWMPRLDALNVSLGAGLVAGALRLLGPAPSVGSSGTRPSFSAQRNMAR